MILTGCTLVDIAIGADRAAVALTEAWQRLLGAVAGGWALPAAGAVALVTGIREPTLNGVWSTRTDPDPTVVAALLDRVAATRLPHCVQLYPGSSRALATLAAARGMRQDREYPLMVLEDAERLGRDQQVARLKIRQLDPGDAGLHVSVAAAGFGVGEERFRQLIPPAVLRLPGVRCYVGEADARPVATGLGVTIGPSVGVFNVATVPASRGLGYGGALTARVVSDGLAAGAAWSWLQSSPRGAGLYARLGFRSVGSFQLWLSAE
jgi:GNAT superfamily N-acetyltransferase